MNFLGLAKKSIVGYILTETYGNLVMLTFETLEVTVPPPRAPIISFYQRQARRSYTLLSNFVLTTVRQFVRRRYLIYCRSDESLRLSLFGGEGAGAVC